MGSYLGSPGVPFCPFSSWFPLLKPSGRKKGARILKGLLRNLVINEVVSRVTVVMTHIRGLIAPLIVINLQVRVPSRAPTRVCVRIWYWAGILSKTTCSLGFLFLRCYGVHQPKPYMEVFGPLYVHRGCVL